MIQFVVNKPVPQMRRSIYHGDTDRRFKGQRKRSLKTVWIIFAIFVFIYGSFLLLKNTLFAQEYTITIVQYDSGDVKMYGDPYLYKTISSQIKQENYSIARFNKNTILAKIQSRYPFIQDMGISFVGKNKVKIDLIFNAPNFLIRNGELLFGVFRGHIFPLFSGDELGKQAKVLHLPPYLSGSAAMTGFFFRQPYSDIAQQLDLIYEGFPGLHHVEYLPGGERSIVFINGQEIYLNNLVDIPSQIKNYTLLKKYYNGFAQLKEIDLGSIELDKIIVKK